MSLAPFWVKPLRDITSVVGHQPQGVTHMFYCTWCGSVPHCGSLHEINFDPMTRLVLSQKWHTFAHEVLLGEFNLQLCLSYALPDIREELSAILYSMSILTDLGLMSSRYSTLAPTCLLSGGPSTGTCLLASRILPHPASS